MTLHTHDDISLGPIQKDLRSYSWKVLWCDFWAGFAVSLLSIPQALAYSIVVGLPPYCGLMTTIFGTAISALLGSSRQLVTGPNNTTVLLVQTATVGILYKYYSHLQESARSEIALQIIAALMLLIGLFQILSGVFKLGRVIQFVSFPVVIGYILGASFALTSGQLYTFLGIESQGDETTLFEKLRYLALHIQDIHPPTALVGVLSLSVLLTLKKMKFRVPASLTMLVIVTPLVYAFHVEDIPDQAGRVLGVIGDAGRIEAVVPSLQLPLFELRLFNALLPIAFAIALISMLETTSIAKSVAANSGQRLRINQELFGLGASNFFLSFFGALPCSGSISRTIVNYDSGAKTRFAAVFSAICVSVFVAFFGTYIQYVPLSALAALIVGTAMGVVDRKQVKLCLRSTHSDAAVLIITFLSCVFFSLHIAFYIGVVMSIVLYLRKAAIPQVVEYGYNVETEELRPLLESEKHLKRKIRIINIEGELFFGAVDLFQSALKAIAEDDDETKVFVVRLKHVRDFDATAATALKQLYDYLRKSGRYLVVASVPLSVWEVLEKAKLVQYIGRDNLYLFDDQNPQVSIDQALNRAWTLIKESEPIQASAPGVLSDKGIKNAPEEPFKSLNDQLF
ncbi:MAG: hypothetical protein JWO53_920 [Chlamydiia bacterium]|nr:hypothetical protein [Chlamydiia bacterium]